MKIYTRGGDEGLTSLYGGARVRKDAARIEAYGTLDELGAVLGWARALLADPELADMLLRIQSELFDLASELATPEREKLLARGQSLPQVDAAQVTQLEHWIDALEAKLQPLRNFILSGGAPAAAALHLARTVCRRAERRTVSLGQDEAVSAAALQYLNRLSDLLFVMARSVNARQGVAEPLWVGRER
jgi:cob(I)alamin adenosyltransferase